jgi:hypothetical protein
MKDKNDYLPNDVVLLYDKERYIKLKTKVLKLFSPYYKIYKLDCKTSTGSYWNEAWFTLIMRKIT